MQRVILYGLKGRVIVYTTVYSPRQETDALLDLAKRYGVKGVVRTVAHA